MNSQDFLITAPMSYMKKQRNQNWGFDIESWLGQVVLSFHKEPYSTQTCRIVQGWEFRQSLEKLDHTNRLDIFCLPAKMCVSSWWLWPHLANVETYPMTTLQYGQHGSTWRASGTQVPSQIGQIQAQKSNSNHLGGVIDFTHATSIGFYQTDLVDACWCIGCNRKTKNGLKVNIYI